METGVNTNEDGAAIVAAWQERAGNIGMTMQAVCLWAEEYIRNNHGAGKLKAGSLNQVVNVWRYTPPAALLLIDALNKLITSGFIAADPMHPARVKLEAKKSLERRVAFMKFSTPILAIRYYLAIEHVLYEKEAAFDHATAVKTADV